MMNWIKSLFSSNKQHQPQTVSRHSTEEKSTNTAQTPAEQSDSELSVHTTSDHGQPIARSATDDVKHSTAASSTHTDNEPSDESINTRLEQAKQLHRQGRIDLALPVYQSLHQAHPDLADVWHMLGVVALQQGQLAQANDYFASAISRDDTVANYFVNAGICALQSNNLTPAIEHFSRALAIEADNDAALAHLTSCYIASNQLEKAALVASDYQRLFANRAEGHQLMANVLLAQKNTLSAITCLRGAIALEPDNVDVLLQLVSCYELQNDVDNAAAYVVKAKQLQPGNPKVIMFEGIVLRRQKQAGKAVKLLQKSLKYGLDKPTSVEAYHQLGLALDESGQYQQAYQAFLQSNQLMASMSASKIDSSGYTDMLLAYQSQAKAINNQVEQPVATKPKTPIFFVAFPRSGTTLMEQVLKAHPELTTTDENSPINAIIGQMREEYKAYPQALSDLTDADKARYRQVFWQHIEATHGTLPNGQLIDKLPLNIVHLPLIRTLFNDAKFIVALRDPRDVVISCFMQKFELNSAMTHFLDLNDAAEFYHQVMTLWQVYKQHLRSDEYIEYRYEDLISDFNATVQRVLDFTGSSWHDEMNSYRQKALQRNISTPSYRDVTNEISTKAVARHQHYKAQLASVEPILKEHIDQYGYNR
ncbi:sulfotransferase [Thalassotalea ponticola]|uniref:tetratricopeptide repeat-containing sulfotransferase family protein n=1 Tax=Thalassotalea ponticola TaxID=1523392 RepID=UPI0025B2ADE0|nr:tetratricopeptide repeat-containing sulfotransferase family protein [Thalassotalea ponticola]MDN3653182.1 sulfotransferase [Thalassotalea ponticola]